jgi:site-specific recombinase XerD
VPAPLAPAAPAPPQAPTRSTDNPDTPGDALPAFVAAPAEDHVSAQTARLYLRHLRRFAAWLSEQYQAGPLAATGHDVRAYRAQLAARQAPASVNAALAALRRFYRWAVATGWVPADPTVRVKPVPAQPLAPKGFTAAERHRLRREAERAVRDPPLRPLRSLTA